MAMVRQLSEGEIVNRSTPEEDNQSPENTECSHSQPSSVSSGSKRSSPITLPSLQYSKDDLMKFSSLPIAQSWPSCLDPAYNNSTGKWDPERWFMNHRTERASSVDDLRPKRLEDGGKRKPPDPKERIKEEKDDIVLSPQRRSFGTGCHVTPQASVSRRPGSPSDVENFRETSRRIGSGRIMNRDQREWERDRDYGYGNNRNERRERFDQDDDSRDLRRFSGGRYNRSDRRSRGGRDRIDEMEPEWFSGGPTSQSDTIELVGFEENQNDGEPKKGSKKAKRAKQTSRRSSLKSDEGEKSESTALEHNSHKRDESIKDNDSSLDRVVKEAKMEQPKSTNTGFDLDELFKMDWIPGLPTEASTDSENKDLGCSRFSQWFRKESPLPDVPESGNNSRRSSLHDELIANVLNSISEPQLVIPSPTPDESDNFFAPISPALSHCSGYALSENKPSSSCKNLMQILQSNNMNDPPLNGNCTGPVKSVKELEADLKRIVLGEKRPKEEKSAFDKLLQHMSDSANSLSMGPLDKSKAVQEQDLLHDMLQGQSSPIPPPFQMFQEKEPLFKVSQRPLPSNLMSQQPNQENSSEMLAHLMQRQEHMHQLHQQQMQHNPNMGTITMDMLSKLLPTQQTSVRSISPSIQTQHNRNDPQLLSSVIQYQRQRELLSSLLKQHQQHSTLPLPTNVLQSRRCPSAKDMPLQQSLTLPSLGVSPRQSPLPPEALNTTITNQGRIPSPLVFGQQPPALSHAPAPIHPATLAQAMVHQNATSPNTLQVQNPVVLQRVPSPQELAVHTQSILQNALIKRKLEEQKENFRKRQEAQRTNSPVPASKNGISPTPVKGVSPTIAFTPTSVMRKIQSEKLEGKEQKCMHQNGNRTSGANAQDARVPETQKNITSGIPNMGIVTSDVNFSAVNNHFTVSQNAPNVSSVPRALHGQAATIPTRQMLGGVGSHANQGRPIVKVGAGTSLNPGADARNIMLPNKPSAIHGMHHEADLVDKFNWQRQMQRIPPQLQLAATYAAMAPPPPINPNLLRPVNINSSVNFPLLRNAVQNPTRAQASSLNPLNQLAALQQLQRGALDSRQLQAIAQTQRLQQMLLNSQNPVAAAAQAASKFPATANRGDFPVIDVKHQHFLPCQPQSSRQSPVTLTKWFGNDVLKQKMPDMPPVPLQKALLVEEVERQQQSTTVRN